MSQPCKRKRRGIGRHLRIVRLSCTRAECRENLSRRGRDGGRAKTHRYVSLGRGALRTKRSERHGRAPKRTRLGRNPCRRAASCGETLDAEGSDSRQEARKTTLSALFLADGKYPTSWSVGVTRSARAPCRLLHANPPSRSPRRFPSRWCSTSRTASPRSGAARVDARASRTNSSKLVNFETGSWPSCAPPSPPPRRITARASRSSSARRRARWRLARPNPRTTPSSSFAARARFASPSSPPRRATREGRPTPPRVAALPSPRPPTPPTPPSARSTTFPPRSPRSNSSSRRSARTPVERATGAGDDPGPGPGPGVAVATAARPRVPPLCRRTLRHPRRPRHRRRARRRDDQHLRKPSRHRPRRHGRTRRRVPSRRRFRIANCASRAPRRRRRLLRRRRAALASCARAVRRVVAELDERWRTTRGEGGTEARGERSRDMNVNGPFVSAARLESDSLAREGRLARVFSVADRVARRLVDEPSLEKRSNTARADAKEAFREMTRATAAAERAAEAERERAPLAARARRLEGTLRMVLEGTEGEGRAERRAFDRETDARRG